MSIFKNTNINIDAKNTDTIIGQDAYFQGTLTAKGSLRVDGRIDGSIVDAKMIDIGNTGKVKGDISAEVVVINGETKGNIVAVQSIEIRSGSKVDGDIKSSRIIIDEGALFNGNCNMSAKEESKTQTNQVRK